MIPFSKICVLILFLTSCASTGQKQAQYLPGHTFSRTLPYSQNVTWKALLKVLSVYPELTVVEQKTGRIETGWVEDPFNSRLYDHPLRSKDYTDFKSRLKLDLLEGKYEKIKIADEFSDGEGHSHEEKETNIATKILITKELVKVNPITDEDSELFNTDGFEEKIILYRLQRILKLEDILLEQKRK